MADSNMQLQWTDEQWNKVRQVVYEEARKARVAGNVLPLCGPLEPDARYASGAGTKPATSFARVRGGRYRFAEAGHAAGSGVFARCAGGGPGAEQCVDRVSTRREPISRAAKTKLSCWDTDRNRTTRGGPQPRSPAESAKSAKSDESDESGLVGAAISERQEGFRWQGETEANGHSKCEGQGR